MKSKIRLKYAFNCLLLLITGICSVNAMMDVEVAQWEQTLAIQQFFRNYQPSFIGVHNQASGNITIETITCWPHYADADSAEQTNTPDGYLFIDDISFDENYYLTYGHKYDELTLIGSGAIEPKYLLKTSTINTGKKLKILAANMHLPRGADEDEEVYQTRIAKNCTIDEDGTPLNTYTFITGIRIVSETPVYLGYQPLAGGHVSLILTNSFVPSYPQLHAAVFSDEPLLQQSLLQRRLQALYDANYPKLLSGESRTPLIMHTILDPDSDYDSQIEWLAETREICSPESGWAHYVWMLNNDYSEIEGVNIYNATGILPTVNPENPRSITELKLVILQKIGGFVRAPNVVPLYDLKQFSAFDRMTSLYEAPGILAAKKGDSVIESALRSLRLGLDDIDPRVDDFQGEDAILLSAILDESNLDGTIVLPKSFIVDNLALFNPSPRDAMLKRYVVSDGDGDASYDEISDYSGGGISLKSDT